ncbi:MAG: hypothetical protein OEM52_07015 [bacterium]|nr:hypothetical protein [bacterium]
MNEKKPKARMGQNPLDWIGAGRGEEAAAAPATKPAVKPVDSKPGKPKPHSTPVTQSVPSLQSTQSVPETTQLDDPSPTSNAAPAERTSSRAGLPEGWTRATFIVKENTLNTVKEYAYWERKEIKTVIEEALTLYFNKHPLKKN